MAINMVYFIFNLNEYFSRIKFAFSNPRFSPFYEHYRQLREKYAFKLKNNVHHVNQLKEPDLMMYTHLPFSKKKPLHLPI